MNGNCIVERNIALAHEKSATVIILYPPGQSRLLELGYRTVGGLIYAEPNF
jgi:hypothetical protein